MRGAEERGGGLTRRALLSATTVATVGSGIVEAVSKMIGPAGADEPAGDEAATSVSVVLRVNGADRPLKVDAAMTLAEALRGPLGLTGTKIACNRGACSACTVWLDGLPICSCMMLVVEIGAREVRTIEGLAEGDRLHPVQAAFIERDAMQCGFCTPGMAMSCAALLEHTPDPTAQDVERAISGHICRCGSYPHVVEATLAAAQMRKG